MYSLLLVGLSAFFLSLLFTPLARNLCLRLGLVDAPDHLRKLHAQPVPRVGGVAIMAAGLASFGVLSLFPLQGSRLVADAAPLAGRLLPAVFLVFLTGLLDDLFSLRPWQKLLGEVGAAALACWGGVSLHIGSFPVPDWLTIPLTLFWLIGCTNAFNLIDGVDGLATGVGLFATFTTLVAALLQGNFGLAVATVPLAGAMLGFLRYNFNPATIFLGDSGSLTIGFLLGCYGVIWSQKSATLLGMTAPLMALAIPLLDTGLSIVRRLLRSKPIFTGDRGHIHHRLLDRGLTPRRVALLLYAVCGVAATFSLLASVAPNHYTGLVVVLFCGAAWIGVQHLGYVEFNLARRLILPGTFLRVLNAQLRLRTLEEELAAAGSVDECWDAIRTAAADFGFSQVSLHLEGVMRSHSTAEASPCWTLEVPLSRSEFVKFGHSFDSPLEPVIVARLADSLRRALQSKLDSFPQPALSATSGALR